MISTAFVAALNHLLDQHAWAKVRLAAHRDARVRLHAPPLLPDITLLIDATGRVAEDRAEPAAGDAPVALRVNVQPAGIPLLLTRHADAMQHVELSGNAALASTVQDLVRGLEWDVEEDLSRVFGDVLAHRIARTGRDLHAWQKDARERTAQNFAEYFTEENPLLARRHDMDRFRIELQSLTRDMDRVQARLDALLKRSRAA